MLELTVGPKEVRGDLGDRLGDIEAGGDSSLEGALEHGHEGLHAFAQGDRTHFGWVGSATEGFSEGGASMGRPREAREQHEKTRRIAETIIARARKV